VSQRTSGSTVVFTYHRIVAERGDFYDLAPDQFADHLALLGSMATPGEDGSILLHGRQAFLTFDDGTIDHLRAAEMILKAGFTATFFVIVSRLGKPGYIAAPDVRRISEAGHRIGSHTTTHRPLPKLPPAEMEAELGDSRRRLEDLTGRVVDWLALPGGYSSRVTLHAAIRNGYVVTRTMRWGYASTPLQGAVPCFPLRAGCDSVAFRRLLEGRANLWPYRMKSLAKSLLGEKTYVSVRDRLGVGRAAPTRRMPT
jgi:peptidoglycan/xylan/chitin deacetylase (PgdA/CDA1 family)